MVPLLMLLFLLLLRLLLLLLVVVVVVVIVVVVLMVVMVVVMVVKMLVVVMIVPLVMMILMVMMLVALSAENEMRGGKKRELVAFDFTHNSIRRIIPYFSVEIHRAHGRRRPSRYLSVSASYRFASRLFLHVPCFGLAAL